MILPAESRDGLRFAITGLAAAAALLTALPHGVRAAGPQPARTVSRHSAATASGGAPIAPEPSPPSSAAWFDASPPDDHDGENWIEPHGPPVAAGRPRLRIGERFRDPSGRPRWRLLSLIRGEQAGGDTPVEPGGGTTAGHPGEPSPGAWPLPEQLIEQVAGLADPQGEAGATPEAARWAAATLDHLDALLATGGLADPASITTLDSLAADATAGLALAMTVSSRETATELRRTALALFRRVTVWRAGTAVALAAAGHAAGQPIDPSAAGSRLLAAVERFEVSPTPGEAAAVRSALAAVAELPAAAEPAVRAVAGHYLGPNLRLTLRREFVSRLLPAASTESGPLRDTILGREVTGTRTVEHAIGVRFLPDPEAVRMELVLDGEMASRTVTATGPVSFHSRGAANFTVRKPVVISADGLAVGTALGSASNRTQLATIQTSFDSVPIMGSLVRTIARGQHDEQRQAVAREVNERIIVRACREMDRIAGPQLAAAAGRVRLKVWDPLHALGLEPTPLVLSTAEDVATVRLRLAGPAQLAAHTPRIRSPDDALVAVQVHESAANNALAGLGLAGRRLALEELVAMVGERLGIAGGAADDLPENVAVSFAATDPLRVACRDGLVHVWVALDALEGSRRTWHDIVAHVAYRPVPEGMQVFLQREGPVQLGGPGHQGRMEIALRTIFGKIFPKERRLGIVPEKFLADPRLSDLRATQAAASDGWLAIALSPTTPAEGPPPAAGRGSSGRRLQLRR